MLYIKPIELDELNDNTFIYVNRNTLNTTIAEYETNTDNRNYEEELKILLSIWDKTYKLERENKRIDPFVKMTNSDIKKCFRNYKTLPVGSFGIIN